MRAFMLVQGVITDEENHAHYRAAVVPLIEAFGGRQARAGPVELLEGRPDERRIALFEFPSMEALRAFWDSPEYAAVKELRRNTARFEIWAIPAF